MAVPLLMISVGCHGPCEERIDALRTEMARHKSGSGKFGLCACCGGRPAEYAYLQQETGKLAARIAELESRLSAVEPPGGDSRNSPRSK